MEVSAESAKEEGHHWLFPCCTILQSEQVNNSIAVIGERMYTYTHLQASMLEYVPSDILYSVVTDIRAVHS